MKNMIKLVLLLSSLWAISACTVIDEGEFGISKGRFSGKINREYMEPGMHFFTMFDDIIEIDGTEVRVELNDLHPKDKEEIPFQDVDLSVTFKINKDKAVAFYLQTKEIDRMRNADKYVLGGKIVEKALNGAVQEAFKSFKSNEAQSRRKDLEAKIKEILQADLDQNFGGAFNIITVDTFNIMMDSNIEKIVQAQAVVRSEQNLMAARKELALMQGDVMLAEMQKYKEVSTKTGVSVADLMNFRMQQEYHKVLSELGKNGQNMQVQVKGSK